MMSLWTEPRPYKEKSREVVAKTVQSGKKKILIMPGDIGHDVELLIQHGIPAKDCHWLVVERDAQILKAFKKRRLLKGYRVTYYNQELSTIPYQAGIDLAWFDFLGNLTEADLRWFLTYPLATNAELFFTFLLAGRGNTVFNQLKETLPKIFPEEIKNLGVSCFSDSAIQTSHRLPILIQWLLLRHILPPANTSCYFYKDTTPMCLYHLRNFETNKEETPINSFIHQLLNSSKNGSEEEIAAQTIFASRNPQELLQAKQRLDLLSRTRKNPKQFKAAVKKRILQMQKQVLELFK